MVWEIFYWFFFVDISWLFAFFYAEVLEFIVTDEAFFFLMTKDNRLYVVNEESLGFHFDEAVDMFFVLAPFNVYLKHWRLRSLMCYIMGTRGGFRQADYWKELSRRIGTSRRGSFLNFEVRHFVMFRMLPYCWVGTSCKILGEIYSFFGSFLCYLYFFSSALRFSCCSCFCRYRLFLLMC